MKEMLAQKEQKRLFFPLSNALLSYVLFIVVSSHASTAKRQEQQPRYYRLGEKVDLKVNSLTSH